jgi:hypothetical protein
MIDKAYDHAIFCRSLQIAVNVGSNLHNIVDANDLRGELNRGCMLIEASCLCWPYLRPKSHRKVRPDPSLGLNPF